MSKTIKELSDALLSRIEEDYPGEPEVLCFARFMERLRARDWETTVTMSTGLGDNEVEGTINLRDVI